MISKKISFFIPFILLLMSPLSAQANGPKSLRLKWVETLGLDREQKIKIRDIHEQFKESIKQKQKLMQEAREELMNDLMRPEKDEKFKVELSKKFQSLQLLKEELQEERFKMALAIKDELNTEQIAKFKQIYTERRANRQNLRTKKQNQGLSDE